MSLSDKIQFVARSVYTSEMERNKDGDPYPEWDQLTELVQTSFCQWAESAIKAVEVYDKQHTALRSVGPESERRGGHEAEPQDE